MIAVDQSDSILLVEDDPLIRNATVRLLRNNGYEVFSAANGADALRFLACHALPRLILLDLEMPEMDGWQFRSQQEQDPVLSRIPVILLSSDENLEDVALSLHAESCLHKPVEEGSLLAALGPAPLEANSSGEIQTNG